MSSGSEALSPVAIISLKKKKNRKTTRNKRYHKPILPQGNGSTSETPAIIITEHGTSCLECNLYNLDCQRSSTPCPRCVVLGLSCIPSLRADEPFRKGIQGKVQEIKKATGACVTKAYTPMDYLQVCVGGWQELRGLMDEVVWRIYVREVESAGFQHWLDSREDWAEEEDW